jgi:hypothetical protein
MQTLAGDLSPCLQRGASHIFSSRLRSRCDEQGATLIRKDLVASGPAWHARGMNTTRRASLSRLSPSAARAPRCSRGAAVVLVAPVLVIAVGH